jgi:Ankyrin repeat
MTACSQYRNSKYVNLTRSNKLSPLRVPSAFVDYSASPSYESPCVQPGVLSLETRTHPPPLLDTAQVTFNPSNSSAQIREIMISGSYHSANETNTPGSNQKLYPQIKNDLDKGKDPLQLNLGGGQGYFPTGVTFGESALARLGVEEASFTVLDSSDSRSSIFLPRQRTSNDVGQASKPLTRKASMDSLSKLLGRRYSHATLEHIKSILCYSSTNSRRSSLVSSLSFGSSWKSKTSLQVGRADSKEPYSFISTEDPLTEIEQTIWGELVDEERLVHPIHRPLHYPVISLASQSRPCCASMLTKPCAICGTSEAHMLVMWCLLQNPIEWPLWLPTKDEINAKDNFDNTPLHFAAASGKASLSLLVFLIEEGADIRAKNTSGETFMHVLNQTSLGSTKNLCRLLSLLTTLSFPFSDRDCHGRTIAHSLLNGIDIKDIPTETWKEILSILKPDIFSFDNLGLDIRGRPRHYTATTKGWPENKLKSWPYIFEQIAPLSPQIALIFLDVSQQIKEWLALVTTFNHVTWVDINGDTLLTSFIKRWPDKYEGWLLERIISDLINVGAEIHMRDRCGHTPLAIAVRRGFTLTTTALLRAGANVNSRNYEGIDILSLSKESLREAKRNDMVLYARILSCMNSIIDHGAKRDPTVYDEYMSREASARQPRAKREYELGEWFSQQAAEWE